ncbi:bifunctional [glutamine synthetase] adenylyltransferase/[glutamine synthetase]-adenylyl-L-tyrosine phosphorylase [Oleispirillum naphthae]|uniref:bifunctional [glutamine synthetase] adenylyltransferase/[glutamine synthetase]-adenylyl-L-tyrosine phosphorylase n=1 Tax=Oleispirillum naphthae TaxID=2838853 RepID=UPI00308247C4
MSDFVFPSQARVIPESASAAAAEIGFERWRALADSFADAAAARAALMRAAAGDAAAGRLLAALFGGSPYLSHVLLAEPDAALAALRTGPEAAFAAECAAVEAACAGETDRTDLMRALRIFKRRAALIIAMADVAEALPLTTLIGMISCVAETALKLILRHLLRPLRPGVAEPEADAGYFLLAMGKLGGRELNYSSDVDLIALYDEARAEAAGIADPRKAFIRLTRDMVAMMETRTAEGYVFRTDLRLRPDPGSTPVAMSTLAAEIYYEGFGQNWERAAMIKARAVAGDLAAGAEFLKILRPYVWRKSLDFNAIQDIHSIKRQIAAKSGGRDMTVAGHNVKLGRGGIREIEFFAQTQQLIWGGRQPQLRSSVTLETLDRLVELGHVAAAAAADLKESYAFLRRVEHRLQMIDDAQTQTLPKEPDKLAHLATFLGHASVADFSAALLAHLTRVEAHYSALFADAPELSGDGGNLVFTGTEDDPDTLATLRGLGFTQPEAVAASVRAWHFGRYRATRSTRAREVLTELAPALLTALGRSSRPDEAFRRFDDFLAQLPAGAQLFALLAAHPPLLDALAELLGDAPKLAEALSRNPSLLDNLMSPEFFQPPAAVATAASDLALRFSQAVDYEDVLNVARRFAKDRAFQIGVQTLRGVIDAEAAGGHLSDLAEAVLRALLPEVEAEFARAHGRIAGGSLAVLAMGRLGSREMTPTSDLDLILIYDAPFDAASDGARPAATPAYYARLVQRLVNALTAPTGEGTLYEVDMRLRPSGNAGPLAASLESFSAYHAASAWTWERQALTRARVVAGDAALGARVGAIVRATLTVPRDADRLLADVAEMRARMRKSISGAGPWEAKQRKGGLIDIDFIVQYLQLRHAAEMPEILDGGPAAALALAGRRGLIPAATAEDLLAARRFWNTVQMILRLTMAETFGEDDLPSGLRDVLCRATGAVDFSGLKQQMETMAEKTAAAFGLIVEAPAAALPETKESP